MAEAYLFAKLFSPNTFIRPIRQTLTPPNIPAIRYDFMITCFCCVCRIKFILFIIHTVIMTSALVLAARKSDPRDYDANVDILRGVCEAALLICILWNIPRELYQLKRYIYY